MFLAIFLSFSVVCTVQKHKHHVLVNDELFITCLFDYFLSTPALNWFLHRSSQTLLFFLFFSEHQLFLTIILMGGCLFQHVHLHFQNPHQTMD